nr:hypothetical protein [Tanacetum cinerariifolium]
MRPFGCHVTILNTLDHLGKIDGKFDDGFFVGYSLNNKAFRVYHIRTRKVKENLHIRFLEENPIIVGRNSNDFIDGSLFDSSSKNASNDEPQPSSDAGNKDDEGGYTQEEGIDYNKIFALVARIEAIRLFLAHASFKDFVVYQIDVKSAFLYGKIKEEVYVCQHLGFEDPEFPDRVYKGEKALYGLHQAHRAWKEMCIEFEKMMHKKFQMSSMGKLTFFLGLFQVTPKVPRLHAVKRIFRYLKGQLKLGLWYLKDSPFNLEAYSDNDYTCESLDMKSTIGGYQFLGRRLISWQCKKQTVVANSTTEAEYIAASICYGQATVRVTTAESILVENADFAEIVDFLNANPIRFLQLFLNNQIDNVEAVFDDEYDTPSHTKKVFANIRRQGKGFLGRVTPLFETMLIQHPTEVGEIPSLSQPKKTQKHRKTKRKATEISQSSGPTNPVANETVHEERGEKVERAATTAVSLDTEQDSGTINRTQSMVIPNEPIPQGTGLGDSPKHQDTILGDIPAQTWFKRLSKQSHEPTLSRVNTLRSGEDRFVNYSSKEESPEVIKEEKVKNSTTQEEGRNDQDEGISFVQEDAETQRSAPITNASAPVSTAGVLVTTIGVSISAAGVSVSTAEPTRSIRVGINTAPQERWSKDQHIELINILSNLGEGKLKRSMAAKLTSASTSECLFADFLSEIEPKRDITFTTIDEGTAKTTPRPKGSRGDKDSGGNKPPADMEPQNPTDADLSGTGESEEDILGAGEEMDDNLQSSKTQHLSSPPREDKHTSFTAPHNKASDIDSSSDKILKKYDYTLLLTKRQLVKYDPAITKKIEEASKTLTKISTQTTEILSSVRSFDFSTLYVTLTFALTNTLANVKGENATHIATKEPLSYTKGETDANIQDKPEELKKSTDTNNFIGLSTHLPSITQAQPITSIYPEPSVPQREGKDEEIKKAKEEARLNAISKTEVIKVVRKEAKKFGIHPKKEITTKAGELFKKAQEAKHEVLKRKHAEKVRKSLELKKHKYNSYMWTVRNRLKLEYIIDIKIHPKTKLVVITVYRGTDGRNFDVHKPFLFGAFGISKLYDLREIIPKKRNTVNKPHLKPQEENESTWNLSLKQESLDWNSIELSRKMSRLWSDIDKVGMEALVSYLVAASMVKSSENAIQHETKKTHC